MAHVAGSNISNYFSLSTGARTITVSLPAATWRWIISLYQCNCLLWSYCSISSVYSTRLMVEQRLIWKKDLHLVKYFYYNTWTTVKCTNSKQIRLSLRKNEHLLFKNKSKLFMYTEYYTVLHQIMCKYHETHGLHFSLARGILPHISVVSE